MGLNYTSEVTDVGFENGARRQDDESLLLVHSAVRHQLHNLSPLHAGQVLPGSDNRLIMRSADGSRCLKITQ
jgi:hypothetical protein